MGGEWYYKVMGQEAGPVSPSELKDLAESGFLGPDVLVRNGADGDWIPAGQVSGLFGRTFQPEAAEPPKPPPADAGPRAKGVGNGGASPSRAAAQPPSEPTPADADWYCQVMGEETGPLSSAQLKELAASGFLTPDVPVRKGVNGSWVPASRVRGLFPGASQVPADRETGFPAPSRTDSTPLSTSDPHAKGAKASASPAPPRPLAAPIVWYYRATGEEIGPLSSGDLKELAKSGLLTPDMPVRMGSDGDWLPAGQVLGLFGEPSKPARPPKSREP